MAENQTWEDKKGKYKINLSFVNPFATKARPYRTVRSGGH
jgi:hypothetical protein